jgi:hypothetical protein
LVIAKENNLDIEFVEVKPPKVDAEYLKVGSRAKESDIGSWMRRHGPFPPRQPGRTSYVGEESPDSSDATDDEAEEDVSYDRLEGEIQQWQEEKQERRLTLLARPAEVEVDPWLQYTKWYKVLNKSKHDLVRPIQLSNTGSNSEYVYIQRTRAKLVGFQAGTKYPNRNSGPEERYG